MLSLRPYQQAAIAAVYRYFEREHGNPLLVLPTGTGKSLVIAELCRRALGDYPDTRILILAHVRELLEQNEQELIRLWPDAPAGVCSAGLRRRELDAQILLAGIQSIHACAYRVQRCDLVLIDEAHLIPRRSGTMYRRFLAELTAINPDLKVVGFTATPYRLDSGVLHEGEDALFDAVAFDAAIAEMIRDGWLAEAVTRPITTRLEVTGVGSRGGEFIAGQLAAAVDIDTTNRAAVEEMVALGHDRRAWLVFCAGVEHAHHVAVALHERGIAAATITGETPGPERDRLIAAFRRGELRCLTNANVLTTGFNVPAVDLLAMLRPTRSAGLYVQMIGRGMRTAPGKANCLVLDFAGNVERHGPIDRIEALRPRSSGEAGAEAPMRRCPVCEARLPLAQRVCPDCGHELAVAGAPELATTASAAAILSSQIEAAWVDVSAVTYARHAKSDSPPSLRVDYRCGLVLHREWVCLEHKGYAREKAVAWWRRRLPGSPVPRTVDEALAVADGLPTPKRIQVRPRGRFTDVIAHELVPCSANSAAARPASIAGSMPSAGSAIRAGMPAGAVCARGPARTSAIGGAA